MPAVGDRVGRYHLERRLGQGAFGEVWLGRRDGALATTRVAVKLPRAGQHALSDVRKEAKLWARAAGHPNILPIIEADVYDGQVAVISEYVEEGSLRDWLNLRAGRVRRDEAVEIVVGLLVGLEHLHARKIVHRDLKPENVLMQGDVPRLTDFGLSRVLSDDTHSHSASGTPPYMAPEAFVGQRSVQTDIWSAGVILYELLTSRLPYGQDDAVALARAVMANKPVEIPAHLPHGLRSVLARALAKETGSRFQTATEMRAALAACLHDTDSIARAAEASTSFRRRYLTVAVTGSMKADEDRVRARIGHLLQPYEGIHTTWYVGTYGAVDETAVEALAVREQQVLVVGYTAKDLSVRMRELVDEHDLPLIDPANQSVPDLPGAPSDRDVFFITKADLVLLIWDGVSPGTRKLIDWLRSVKRDYVVGFV